MLFPSSVFLNYLLKEYITRRMKSETTTILGAFTNLYSRIRMKKNDINTMRNICESFSEDFQAADRLSTDKEEADKWVEIMLKLGLEAFKSQAMSAKQSQFCKTAHALRSHILNVLNQSEIGKKAVADGITKLKTDYVKAEEIKNATQKDTAAINREAKLILDTDACYIIIRNLAYLGHIHEVLKDDPTLRIIFPQLECVPDSNNLMLPCVLHDNYIQTYCNRKFAANEKTINIANFEDEVIEQILNANTIKLTLAKYKSDLTNKRTKIRNSPASSTSGSCSDDSDNDSAAKISKLSLGGMSSTAHVFNSIPSSPSTPISSIINQSNLTGQDNVLPLPPASNNNTINTVSAMNDDKASTSIRLSS